MTAEKMDLRKAVNYYLWHGFVPPCTVPRWITDDAERQQVAPDYSVRRASQLTDELIDRLCSNATAAPVVPLSGGWDSRFILGALLERYNAADIHTVTYGTGRQLDFDVGRTLARTLRTKHHPIDTSEVKLQWSELLEATKRAPWSPSILALFNQEVLRLAGRLDRSLWSGFIGDLVNGGHAHELTGLSREKFLTFFRASQKASKSVEMCEPGFTPDYPDVWLSESAWVPAEELWFVFYRVLDYTAPSVLCSRMKGWVSSYINPFGEPEVLTPFTDEAWAEYWFRAPYAYRYGQKLFRELCKAKYPKLFAMPSKYTWGLPPRATARQKAVKFLHHAQNQMHRWFPGCCVRSARMDNYIDFHYAFQEREDYKAVLDRAIAVLTARKATPWLNLEVLRQEHQAGRRDHSQSLLLLVGLALNLEVNTDGDCVSHLY